MCVRSSERVRPSMQIQQTSTWARPTHPGLQFRSLGPWRPQPHPPPGRQGGRIYHANFRQGIAVGEVVVLTPCAVWWSHWSASSQRRIMVDLKFEIQGLQFIPPAASSRMCDRKNVDDFNTGSVIAFHRRNGRGIHVVHLLNRIARSLNRPISCNLTSLNCDIVSSFFRHSLTMAWNHKTLVFVAASRIAA